MNLKIRSFANNGDITKERIICDALADIDVGRYALFRSSVASNGKDPTAGRKMAYWFPDHEVKAGDSIVLYTKKGERRSKTLIGGNTAHFFYWGKDESQWKDSKFGAVLLDVWEWQFKIPDPS